MVKLSFLPLLPGICTNPFHAVPSEFRAPALAAAFHSITLHIFHHFSVFPLLETLDDRTMFLCVSLAYWSAWHIK